MTNPGTADPKGARAHAHAMAGTKIEAMPTVPAGSTPDLPAGVVSEEMLWEETISAGGYASKELSRGSRLRLTDLYGDSLRVDAGVQRGAPFRAAQRGRHG